MVREEILQKLTDELSDFIYQVEDPKELIRTYLNYALDIGTYHFRQDAIPVAKMDEYGKTLAVYQSANEASRKTNISAANIKSVMYGKRHMAGGFMWKQLIA